MGLRDPNNRRVLGTNNQRIMSQQSNNLMVRLLHRRKNEVCLGPCMKSARNILTTCSLDVFYLLPIA